MIILARLLTPKIFGLIGMLTIFIQLSNTLVTAGFNQALIQKKDTDEEDYSSVFWINLTVSLLMYGILFFTAPLIADFYKQPVLTELTRALSLAFIIDAFSYVQEAKMRKEMRFKTLTIIHIPSIIIGGIISVIMALKGFGVWSIVAMQLATRLAYVIQIWIYSKWKPLFSFNYNKARKLFSFGSKLMLSSILDTVFNNIYIVVIGKFFSVSKVGYYQNANTLVKTPSSALSDALTRVAFPAFSSIQDDNKRLKEGYKKIIQQVLFWLCPIFILAGVLAEPLFRFVFTEKWLPAVPYFRILCITGIMLPLHIYNLNIVNVKGRSDIFLKLEIIKKIFVIIGLVITLPIGIYALLIFQAFSSVILYFVNGHFSGKFIDYPIPEQIRDILPVIFLSLGVGLLVFFLNTLLLYTLADFPKLILCAAIGIGLYGFIAGWIKLAPYMELKQLLYSKLHSKK